MQLAALCTLTLGIALPYLLYASARSIYDAFFGPLSRYPGPKLRALSNIPDVITSLRGDEAKLFPQLHEQYGPVVRLAPTRLSFIGPGAFQDIYGPKSRVYKDPFYYGKHQLGVGPIINADNASHSRQRKVLSVGFSAKALRDLEPKLKFWAERMTERFATKSKAGESCDMVQLYNCATFDIMGDFVFSEDLGMLSSGKYAAWLVATFQAIKAGSKLVAIKTISHHVSLLVDTLLGMSLKLHGQGQSEKSDSSTARMRRRLAKTPDPPDMWSRIVEKASSGDFSEGEHYANSAFFMLAGSETTATALSGTTYCLLKHPYCLEKLTQEIRAKYSSFEDVTLDSLAEMKYLQAVLQEGLRICPPVPSSMARTVQAEGAIICGKPVPPGTNIGVTHLSAYHFSGYWKDPHAFRPERWLEDPIYKDDRLDVFEPFSVGPRDCLGKSLAWHEMRLLLAAVLLRFDIELCDESASWLEGLKIFGLWEKTPLMCRLKSTRL